MTREELEHAIRAACDVADDSEIYVFGSQAILGQYPDAHSELTMSAEADVVPKNFPDRADAVDGALGEESQFHATHGFYVHGISLSTATLSKGWEKRCIKVQTPGTNGKIGWCLEGHDLALAKLDAFRAKDRSFVRILLREKLVEPARLAKLLEKLPISAAKRSRLAQWLERTAAELFPRSPKRRP